MTYASDVNSLLRTPIKIVDLGLDTKVSVEKITNGTTSELPLLHCDDSSPLGSNIYPTIESIKLAPIRATPLKGLGYRGKVTIRFKDFPLEKGTYFGRLIGSNPYYLDRTLKLYHGFYSEGDSFDINNFNEHLYFIKSIDGPSDKGIVTIEAVDLLSKLDSDQAICPDEYELKVLGGILETNPTNVTSPMLNSTQTGNFTFTNGDNLPEGTIYIQINSEILEVICDGTTTVNIVTRGVIGTTAATHTLADSVTVTNYIKVESASNTYPVNLDYHWVRVDDEIIYTQVYAQGILDIQTRATLGSKIEDHSEDEKLTICYVKQNVNVVDVIYDLIDKYSEIATSYINLTEWNAERDSFLQSETIDLVVSESTSTKKLIESLTTQCYILIWWDDENQKIKLKSIGPNLGVSRELNHNQHVLNVNHRIRTSQLKAINEVWVYYNRRNWAEDEEKPTNYKNLYVYLDAQANTNLGVRKVKKIFADSVRTEATASTISKRYVAQNKEGQRNLYFSLDPSDGYDLMLGDVVNITTDLEQDLIGNPVTRSYLIVEKEDERNRIKFQADATGFLTGDYYATIAPNSQVDFTSASTEQKDQYAFIADTVSEEMSDGSDPYLIR